MVKVSSFFKNYKAITISAVILMFVQTLGTVYIPRLMADIVNNGIAEGDMAYIYSIGAKMLITAAITVIVAVVGAWLASTMSARWGKDVRIALFNKVQRFSDRDFKRFGTASMITRSTNDVAQLQDSLLLFMQLILPAPFITIGALILAFAKDVQMALLIVATVGVFLIVAYFICRQVIPLFQKLRIGMDEMNRVMRERISGVRVIRAFNKEPSASAVADSAFLDYGKTSIRVNKIFAVMMPLVLIIINLSTLAIVWFGGVRVTGGYMQVGDIMMLVEYALLIFWNLVMGVVMLTMLPKAQTCAMRINEALAIEPEIADGAQVIADAGENAILEFKNVTFQYDHAEEPVLAHLNFSCKKGQTTAIIGGTGAGKSTIASLIMRFYDVNKGEILLRGTPIKNIAQSDLRDAIGFVPQKAFLFSGTIEDNLRYGSSDATMQELAHAVDIAQASDFIASTKKGYQSFVAQGGSNFSGGQKQRLCIARALAKKAELYVFDDSFSALDFKTDSQLRAALKREIKDAAIVIVAQRAGSIIDADQIIVLDNGGVAAIGTHSELISSCEVYKEIVKSQMKEVQ